MILPRRPHGVVFDMDGLLFDTEVIVRDAMTSAAARLGFSVPEGLFLSLIGLGSDTCRTRLLDHYGNEFDLDGFWAAVDLDFNRALEGRTFLKTGVVELLDWLDEAGVPRAIATSSQHTHVDRNLAIHGLTGRFDAIVAHGDYPLGKPAPDPFLKAASELGLKPEHCLALEDSLNGVRAASAAGMMTIMVPDLIGPSDESRAACLGVANDLHEVRALLEAARRSYLVP